MDKLRQLAEVNSPVMLRGFVGAGERNTFLNKAHEMGSVQRWKFGELLVVRDVSNDDVDGTRGGLNNVLSAEAMPMHFDGLFKIVLGVPQPPR
jgi:hypothetical protein